MSKQDRNKSTESKDDDEERMRSPSVLSQSSVTSGALEWDHTADIGKYKESSGNDGTSGPNSGMGIGDISTIERMAINKSSDRVNKSSNPNTERQQSSSKVNKGDADQAGSSTSETKKHSSDEDSHTVKDDQPLERVSPEEKDNILLDPTEHTEKKRWSSVDYSILEKGAFGFFNISASKKETKSEKIISKKDSSNMEIQDARTNEPENKSETGESQFADASDSPFEDKHSPHLTDAHDSTSNSEFVDANDSATGEHTTSEFTDAHESIDVQFSDSDRSKRTGDESGGSGKESKHKTETEYHLFSSPTYTVLNKGNKRPKGKPSFPKEDIKHDTISSSDVSDPLTSREPKPTSSRKFSSTDSQTTYPPTSARSRSNQSELGVEFRTSSPIQKTNNKLYNIQDSQTEPGDTSDENPSGAKNRRRRGRGASDASTDWEYGNENSKSDQTTRSKSGEGGPTASTHSDNVSSAHHDIPMDRSSLSRRTSYQSGLERTHSSLSASEWQTSGLTRSELEYKTRQTNTSSTGTSSVIWLELLANQENDLDGDPKLLKLRNRGVQTQATTTKKVNKRIGTGNDPGPESSSSVLDDSDRLPHAQPQHVHKRGHTRREENPRLRREEKVQIGTTSSSELSPACKLIEKIIKTSPTKPNKLMKAIDEHKHYHATKVEKDLRHLQRLVKILHGPRGSPPSSSHPSSSTADETDSSYMKKCLDKLNKDKRASKREQDNREDLNIHNVPYNHRSNKHSQTSKSAIPVDEESDVGTSHKKVLIKGTSYKVPEGHGDKRSYVLPSKHKKYYTDKIVQSQIPSHKGGTAHVKIDPLTEGIHRRIDSLSSKFDTLAELLILSQEIAIKKELERDNDKKELHKGKAEKVSGCNAQVQTKNESVKKPLKPSVCFYIPFPNCRGSPYAQGNIRNDKQEQIAERRNLNESPIFDEMLDNGEREPEEDSGDSDNQLDSDEKENCFPSLENQNCKSLQDAFERYHAEFISRTREREAILAQIKTERELRAELKRDWIRKYGECPSDASETLEKCLPPKGPRVMTLKEMKQITAKNYKKALEVQERNLSRKQEQEKKTNRLMSQLFAKKLRQKALRGDVNILHSTSLVRK